MNSASVLVHLCVCVEAHYWMNCVQMCSFMSGIESVLTSATWIDQEDSSRGLLEAKQGRDTV